MFRLIHLFLVSISVLSQQNLSPINRCMGSCMICDPNQLSLCSGQQYVQCMKGYDGTNCQIKDIYLEQLRFIDPNGQGVDKKVWEISSTAFCYYNNSKGQSKKIQALGIYNQFQSNKLSFSIKPWYQYYHLQFNLIRTSWTPYSDLLRVASFDQDQNQLNQYFIEYQKRDEIHPDMDKMRCKNLPYLVEKFSFQGKFDNGQKKMIVHFEGMMFSQSQWAISDLRLAVGCSSFLVFDGNACQTCHKGYYPILNMHSDLQRCMACPVYCQQCSQNSKCSECIQGYSLVQNKCTSKNPTKDYSPPKKTLECGPHKLHRSQQIVKQRVGKIQQIEQNIPIQLKHTQVRVIFNLYYSQSDRQKIMNGNVKVYLDGLLAIEVIGEDLLYGDSDGYVVDRCRGFGQAEVFSIFKVVANTIQHNNTQVNFKIQAIGIQAIAIQNIHLQHVYKQPKKDTKKVSNIQGNKQKQKQKGIDNKPISSQLAKNNDSNMNQQNNSKNRGINKIQETNNKQNKTNSQKSADQVKQKDEKKAQKYDNKPKIQAQEKQKPNKNLSIMQQQKQNKIVPQKEGKKQNKQQLDQPTQIKQNKNIRSNSLDGTQKQNTSNNNTTSQQSSRISNSSIQHLENQDHKSNKNSITHNNSNQSQNSTKNSSKKQQNGPISQENRDQLKTSENKHDQQLQPKKPLSPVQTIPNKEQQKKSLYQSEMLDHPNDKQASKNVSVQAQKSKQARFGSSTAILPEEVKPTQIKGKDKKQEQMQKIDNKKNNPVPTTVTPTPPAPSASQNNLIKVSQVISIIEKIRQKIIIGIKQSKEFILTITYPIELDLEYFPSVSAYFKNINKTLTPEVIRQYNNYHYQELAFNLNTSLLDETISIQLIKPNGTNSTNNSSADNSSKPANSSQNKEARLLQQSLNNVKLAQISIPRYDYLSDDQWNSINRFSIFFQIIAWFAIISTIILTLMGNSVVTQKFVLLLQMTFLHVYIYSQYLPINFKVTISGMQRLENLDYFADNSSLSNSIEYSLLGNMIQFSPSRFTMFNKDINFTRAIYPTIIINLVYLIWYLMLYLIKWKIQPNFILIDYQQCSKIKKLKFHLIRIAERPMNFWYQVWQYQYIVFIWTACIQIYNYSYPNSPDNTYIVNFVFSSLCLLITLLLPALTFLYLNKRYFRLDYFEYSYWYHNIFFLKIPEENLPSQHHRVLIMVRNFRYIILVIMIAFLGNQPLICLPIIILTNLLSLVYTKVAHIQIKPFNSKLNIMEHLLLILLSISIIVAFTTSKVLNTESYLIIGNIIITICLLIVVIGLVRVVYYLYHKINDGVRDNQYNNYKPPIQTIKTL